MVHLLKLFWWLVKELMFDSKEEYSFKSKKFNAKRWMAAILLILSMFLNAVLTVRFYDVATSHIGLKKEHAECVEARETAEAEVARYAAMLDDAEERLKRYKKQKALEKKASGGQIQ